jgi:hypothetical protein
LRIGESDTQMHASGPRNLRPSRTSDDFCIDEDAGVAYVTTHRENTIDCMSLDPAKNSERHIVAGDPFTEALIGPSSAAIVASGRAPPRSAPNHEFMVRVADFRHCRRPNEIWPGELLGESFAAKR